MVKEYSDCALCPNYCHVDRNSGERGVCGEGVNARISWAGLHRGEEPPISGEKGSGMLFFTGCPLHCKYCQNIEISRRDNPIGFEISIDELSYLMLDLEKMGAKTLSFVTGTHFIPTIIASLKRAREKGLSLKTVWNTSSFESVEGLELIDPYIDLYLADLKTLDERVSKEFCGGKKYKESVLSALDWIKERHPETDLDLLKGCLVRHLVFPLSLDASKEVLRVFKERYYPSFQLSLMTQFVPPFCSSFKELSEDEYYSLIEYVESLGIEDGFIQENGGDDSLWLPHFESDNPFPDSFAEPSEFFLKLKRSKR